jgi:hypothetical protein
MLIEWLPIPGKMIKKKKSKFKKKKKIYFKKNK